jgi:K+-transporting ATPase ATPase B chain
MAKPTERAYIWTPTDLASCRAWSTRAASSIRALMAKNPVMFVVESGALHDRAARPRRRRAAPRRRLRAADHALAVGDRARSRTWPKRWPKAAARRRPTTLRSRAPNRREPVVNGRTETVSAAALAEATSCRSHAGEFIPSDGEIIEGVAIGDESAITGESAPVIREPAAIARR